MEQVQIRPWGNSQGVRIPKDILAKLGLSTSDTLQMRVTDDAIILRKSFPHRSFEDRLAEFDGKIDVGEFDWGEPAGKELV